MEQVTILEYAQQYLSDRIERLSKNIESETISPFQKRIFESKIAKYTGEYNEVSEMLKEFD